MDSEQRRAQGAHYTTEKNILKVIEPLFMDDLRAEFERLKVRKDNRRNSDLKAFQRKLGDLRFFDPACGCGNFLVIAYRELRILELDILKEIRDLYDTDIFDVSSLSWVDVHQFYGIEINEFPVRIAETALWMMDHIMNNRLSLEFGHTFARIPLKSSPSIVHGDALEIDWDEVLSPEDCSFVFGNPPFSGAKIQSPELRAQVRRIANLGGSGGTLDFVSAWFIKAGEYIHKRKSRIGFVATNSIIQGEQVAQLWPILFNRCELKISFAHRTFAWGSDARGKAHVHVVIIGLDERKFARPKTRLFSYEHLNGEPNESKHASLSPYLIDASKQANPHLTVREESIPLNHFRKMVMGCQPIDGKNYIFDETARDELLRDEPEAEQFLHPYVGAHELIQGGNRWILALHNAPPNVLARLPHVRSRVKAVQELRKLSPRRSTQKLAETPVLYQINLIPDQRYLVVPGVSSENREYVPMSLLEPPIIPSNALLVLEHATLIEFGILTSAMHMAWLRQIGGRLESRYRYSVGLVYNTFPTPLEFSNYQANLSTLEEKAKSVLDARAAHSGATLAQLYDPSLMPTNLRKAHQALDRIVDRLYRTKRFESERERVEHLFMLYEKIRVPLAAKSKRSSSKKT